MAVKLRQIRGAADGHPDPADQSVQLVELNQMMPGFVAR
jgi:hypothetical protein